MDSDKQSQATLDLRQLSVQPHTSHWLSKNLICVFVVRTAFKFHPQRRDLFGADYQKQQLVRALVQIAH